MRKTKILATLGPASGGGEVPLLLAREGADCFRINFSHGNRERWAAYVSAARKVEERLGRPVGLVGDLTGPTVRISLERPVEIQKGEGLTFSYGEGEGVRLEGADVLGSLEVGDEVVIDEGRLRFVVQGVGVRSFEALALVGGVLKPGKKLAVTGKELESPPLTEKDFRDLSFVVSSDFDYVGLSFVRSPSDVRALRDLLDSKGRDDVRVIAKIETSSAVDRVEDIARESDALMIARGDLGIHFPLEEIPAIQRRIIRAARSAGKPALVATQLLESMVSNPVPTRSEVVDVMMAVSQGADALVLAGETAVGGFPVEAVRWIRKIVERAEEEYRPPPPEIEGATIYDNFARGVALLADSLGAKILIYTRSGRTAERISRYRPSSPIHASTGSKRVARQMSLLWGVNPIHVDSTDREGALSRLVAELKESGAVSFGDLLVLAYGLTPGATDVLRIMAV